MVIIMIGCEFFFCGFLGSCFSSPFFFKDNKQKKGQSYSNGPTAHFGGNIAGLVNSIHIFCVSFLTYRTSGKI